MLREKPGPLSSIDMVPDEGRDDIQWALDELNRRQRTQADILFELNDRLAVHGIAPISRSVFNRRAVREYSMKRRTEDRCAILANLAPQFTPDTIGKCDTILGELLKTIVVEMCDAAAGSLSPKAVMELSQAYVKILQGQRMSAELQEKFKADAKKKVDEVLDRAAGAVGEARPGVDLGSTIKRIREEVYGIFEAAA